MRSSGDVRGSRRIAIPLPHALPSSVASAAIREEVVASPNDDAKRGEGREERRQLEWLLLLRGRRWRRPAEELPCHAPTMRGHLMLCRLSHPGAALSGACRAGAAWR